MAKGLLLVLILFFIIFIILKIFIKAYKKYKTSYNKKRKKNIILNILNSNVNEEEKFNELKNILGLYSSYKLAIFLKIDNKELLDLIKEKKYNIINNMIYNKIINSHD